MGDATPHLRRSAGGVLDLSDPALHELLAAVLERGVDFRFLARGVSMQPIIQDGDVITVSPLRGRAPLVGEVVVYRGGEGRLVVHRVVRRTAGSGADCSVETRGDNCPQSDGFVAAADVMGAVTRVERHGKPLRRVTGPECALLAGLSRYGVLQPILGRTRRLTQPWAPATPFGPSTGLYGARAPSDAVPPDARVLLAVIRGIAGPAESSGLDIAVRHAADWEAVVGLAVRHGLVAQLHGALVSAPARTQAAVPPEIRARLASYTGTIAVRSLWMTQQLLVIMDQLAAAGVPALAVRGPALSQLAYGEFSLRQFVDLDILVRPSDVHDARAALEAAGLVGEDAVADLPWVILEAAEQEMALFHPTTRLMVELHWRIGPRFAADSLLADELFVGAGAVDLLGMATPTLSRPDSVLALTVHASAHEWNRLDDVATLCGLLSTFTDGEWRALRSLACTQGCRRRLAVGLCLARDVGGLSIQLPYSHLAGHGGAHRLAREAEAFLLGARPWWWAQLLRVGAGVEGGATTPGERFGRLDRALGILWQARALDSRRAGLRHLWRRLMASGARDWTITGDARPAWLPGPLAQLVRRQRRLWGR